MAQADTNSVAWLVTFEGGPWDGAEHRRTGVGQPPEVIYGSRLYGGRHEYRLRRTVGFFTPYFNNEAHYVYRGTVGIPGVEV